MSFSFDPADGLVVVPTEIFGPAGSIIVRLALDTGATVTMLNVAPLAAIEYDPSLVAERVQVTTGSGIEFAPLITIDQLHAFGLNKKSFPVLSHTLPASASIDGLLGLDFFLRTVLSINFREGTISLDS